jgi:hypothetical protein
MAQQWLRRTGSLIFTITVVLGLGPLHAQRHDADEFTLLRGEVRQLYSEGNYTDAIPHAERYVAIARVRYGKEHREFETAISWLASVYYAQAVRCLGSEMSIGEFPPRPDSP